MASCVPSNESWWAGSCVWGTCVESICLCDSGYRFDNGFHQGNRCDISEALYNAAFGTLLALNLVVVLLLLSKAELPGRDKELTPMQYCVWLGLLSSGAQSLALTLGWGDGMNAASLSMLQVSVAAYIVTPYWVLKVMLKPLQAFSRDSSGINAWDAKRRLGIRVALLLHIIVMVPAIWVATTIFVQPPGWQGMHTIEWLHCLWMSFTIFEFVVLLSLVRSVSRALIGAIGEHVAGPTNTGKNEALHAVAFRVKIFEYVIYIIIVGVILLMVVPMAFKATYGFFPLTTLHYAVGYSTLPIMNSLTAFLTRSSGNGQSTGKRSSTSSTSSAHGKSKVAPSAA